MVLDFTDCKRKGKKILDNIKQVNLYNDMGYIKYIDHMGSDLSFTKAARASFAKDSPEWNKREEKLLKFLYREGHMSVFRHAAITFQI